jgi:hypothetical protein
VAHGQPKCTVNAVAMARLELIFGATSKRGFISDRAWKSFLAAEVTPRFPEGLTAYDAYGQWKSSRGVIEKLPSRVLLIWYAPGAGIDAKIEAIREAYKARYRQESVMRVDGWSCVSF